jgi:hypothetical protein
MNRMNQYRLNLRQQKLNRNTRGYNVWTTVDRRQTVTASRTAVLLCDVWDNHPFRSAVERLEAIVPRMSFLVATARGKGAAIIHAPSDTMGSYTDSPARIRAQSLPPIEPPPDLGHEPLPFVAKINGSDTRETNTTRNWTRQHAGIGIDEDCDLISDNVKEVTASSDTARSSGS